LEQLKKQARKLLTSFLADQPAAVALFQKHLSVSTKAGSPTTAPQLSDAQLVLARYYGFSSWPKLKSHVEVSSSPDRGYGMHELTPVLPVKDVLATVAYYRDLLGWKVNFVDAHFARVSQYKAALCFAVANAENRSWLPLLESGEPLPTGYIQISLGHTDGSEDMDGLFKEYLAKGVKIISEPTVTPHGKREFEIEDCNGYRFCFSVDA
jgi:predicted enzyme related to lactoylglutathione lyase